ncbi:hypothetical protein QYE76_013811 [Lolium multiflorum]|uniref:Transposase (putative) gypsy type domain-containing protein n=1 Tax=Lolium multiflorum TaxID=4521 RepID=A0AAD8X809_LOLMU|nr:hypothetical protein QYE76_013811 [Lolium multiflorum]
MAAPSRLEPREQRDRHDLVTLAAAKEVEDEREQHLLQIDADEDDRRRNFVRRHSKAALDPSYARLIGNHHPPLIRGHPELRAPSPTTSTSPVPRGTATPLTVRLAQPFSASSSNALGRIPTLQEIQEELEGQARMAEKLLEAEQKKGSIARNREGEKGQWWLCEVTDSELRAFQNEGMIAPDWSFMKDSITHKPDPDECVFTKAWVERGLSLPCSEFFLSILNTYGLQPHNICPNSYLLLSNFVTLCEGHLVVRPDIRLWQFFFRVKKETKDKVMVNCGTMTFMLRPGRMYPPHSSHESVRYWNVRWFYVKNIQVPDVHEGLPKFINKPPEELASWSFVPALAQYPELDIAAWRISWDEDQLRVTRDNLPTDSLNKRIKTLVKITRGQPVPEIVKDIKTNNHCPPLNNLAEEDFRNVLRVPTSAEGANEDPKDDEEEEQAPKKAASRIAKRPRGKVSGSEAGASGEASTKNAKTKPPPRLDSKKAESDRLKLLSTIGEKGGGSCSATKRAAPGEPQDRIPEEAEVTSHDKAEAPAKDAIVFPDNFSDPSNMYSTPKAYSHKFFHKLTEAEKWELEQDLLNSMLSNAWGKADIDSSEIQLHKKEISDFFDQLLVKRKVNQYSKNSRRCIMNCIRTSHYSAASPWATRMILPYKKKKLRIWKSASSSLATASSEIESLRSTHKDLETKLMEADQKREYGEKQLAEKNSELLKKEADFVIKWKVDIDTLHKLQNKVYGLRNYMNTAEKCWDILNTDVMEPLGYDEERRNQFPRDDLIRLTGEDCNDLISACRKICYNFGYDTRIVRRIRHDEFYDKVVLPTDEALEVEYAREREAEARPVGSGDEDQFTWTSSKDKSKGGATSPAEEVEDEDDEGVVSFPAKGTEGEQAQNEYEARSSPAKEK